MKDCDSLLLSSNWSSRNCWSRVGVEEVTREENSPNPASIWSTPHARVGQGTPAPLSINYQSQPDTMHGLCPTWTLLLQFCQGGLHPYRSRTKPCAWPVPCLSIRLAIASSLFYLRTKLHIILQQALWILIPKSVLTKAGNPYPRLSIQWLSSGYSSSQDADALALTTVQVPLSSFPPSQHLASLSSLLLAL